MNRLWAALVAVVLVVLPACSDDSEVGTGIDTRELDGGGPGAIRDTTTTSEAPATTAAPTTAPPTTRGPATTAAPATTQAPKVAIVIGIYSDTSGKNQFEPRQAAVARGSTVRWQNFDTVPRSVEEQNGAFRSPSIPPGGTYDYRADRPGTYNYADGTRPYAVGQLVVG